MSQTTPLSSHLAVDAHQNCKRFGAHEVLRGVSLQVHAGEVIALIGASGSGKSTLLRCLNHLEVIDTGTIRIGGQVLAQTPSAGSTAQYPAERDIRQICSRAYRPSRTI